MRPPKKKPPMDDPSDYRDPRLPKNDGQCEYCGCALPAEYHPSCKVCGGPRKAARAERVRPRWGYGDSPLASIYGAGGFLVPAEFRALPQHVNCRCMDLPYYSKLTFAWGAEQAAEQEDAAWRGLEGFAPRKEGLSAQIARYLRGGE